MTMQMEIEDVAPDTLHVTGGRGTPEEVLRSIVDGINSGNLETCLARLADRERAVILLTFYAEKNGSEVGKELRLTEGNVRVIRHRAIGRLRECITSSPSREEEVR